MKAGLTMLEVMVVVVIIAILASFAMPQYAKTQEKGLDSEAKANLVLIQAAENLYITESDAFYGAAGASAHTDLNKELNTNLPPAGGKWNYITKVTAAAGTTPEKVCVQATRNGYDNRSWYIMNVDNAPSVGVCP